jgi:hypothetical protein
MLAVALLALAGTAGMPSGLGMTPIAPAVLAQSGTVVNANEYPSIQAAIDGVRATGGAVYVPAGVHVVSSKIRLYSNITLFGDGIDRTIIKPADSMDDHLLADNSASSRDTNIVVRDLTLQGPNRASAQTGCCHGLRFVNLADSAVINVKSDGHSKDGIYLGYYNANNVTNVRVSGCVLTNNWRNGLSLTHGTGNIVDNCRVENNNQVERVAGIDLEPDSGLDVSNNKVVGNLTNSQNVGIQLYSFDRRQAVLGNNAVCTNTVRYNSSAGIYDYNGTKNIYVNNTATENGGSSQVNLVLDRSAVLSSDYNQYCLLPALPAAPPKPGTLATPTSTSATTPSTQTPTPTGTSSGPATPTLTPTVAAVTQPGAPTQLKARGNQGAVRLTWTASATAGVTYNVYRGTTSGGELVYKTGVSGTQYTDNDVQSRVAYYYRVTAVNATGGESQPSNEASAQAR